MFDDPMVLFEKLVRTPTGPDVPIDEKLKRTMFIRDILEEIGFEVETRNGSHIATKGDPPYITLIGHLDTVFPEGEEVKRPFIIEGDIVYGPAVADMKGGIVLMLELLKRIDINGISVIMNVDEEIGSFESKKVFMEFSKKTMYCLSFEPAFPNGELVSMRKGAGRLKLIAYGRKGHAARLNEGANAIVELSDKIVKIWKLNCEFEFLTINPTLIKGGIKSNVTPDYSEVSFDLRYYEEDEIAILKRRVDSLIENKIVDDVNLAYSINTSRKPMKKCDELLKIVEEMGYSAKMSAGAGDAAFFEKALDGLGLPGGFFHSEKEYAILKDFEKKVKDISKLIEKIKIR